MDDKAEKAVPLTKDYDPPVAPLRVELVRWRGRARRAGCDGCTRALRHAGKWGATTWLCLPEDVDGEP